jgi:hypothetical protein
MFSKLRDIDFWPWSTFVSKYVQFVGVIAPTVQGDNELDFSGVELDIWSRSVKTGISLFCFKWAVFAQSFTIPAIVKVAVWTPWAHDDQPHSRILTGGMPLMGRIPACSGLLLSVLVFHNILSPT